MKRKKISRRIKKELKNNIKILKNKDKDKNDLLLQLNNQLLKISKDDKEIFVLQHEEKKLLGKKRFIGVYPTSNGGFQVRKYF